MSTDSFEIPPGSENDNLGPPFRSYVIFLIALTMISIVLRLWSRFLTSAADGRRWKFGWDDGAAVVSVILILAQLILSIALVDLGVGLHAWFVLPENLTKILQLLLATYIIYGLALTTTKATALLFYSRVFPSFATPRWFSSAVWITHGFNMAWLVAYTIVELLQCRPIARFWDYSLEGTCLKQSHIYIGAAVPSVLIDLTILILPVPCLYRLKTSRARKVGLFVVFTLGYGVVVVSIGRLVTALKFQDKLEQDLTYEGVSSFWWGILEAPITLFGVCIPAMVPLGRRIQGMILSPLASSISVTFWRSRTNESKTERLTTDSSA